VFGSPPEKWEENKDIFEGLKINATPGSEDMEEFLGFLPIDVS
jgi:serine/threonine protein kinase